MIIPGRSNVTWWVGCVHNGTMQDTRFMPQGEGNDADINDAGPGDADAVDDDDVDVDVDVDVEDDENLRG